MTLLEYVGRLNQLLAEHGNVPVVERSCKQQCNGHDGIVDVELVADWQISQVASHSVGGGTALNHAAFVPADAEGRKEFKALVL